MTAALYTGVVTHVRFRPRRHRLRYRMAWLSLDIDAPAPRTRLFSRGRFNLFNYRDEDHLNGVPGGARAWFEWELAKIGVDLKGGAIRVLCMPRILGFVFNPISVWFCHHPDGPVAAMLYEVNNTFGERHFYLIPVTGPHATVIEQTCEKRFHVSPFLPMAMTYAFRVTRPENALSLVVHGDGAEGRMISACFAGRRQDLTDGALLRLLASLGWLTLEIVAAIHWEGLKLWWKGLRIFPHPGPPAYAVTTGGPRAPSS